MALSALARRRARCEHANRERRASSLHQLVVFFTFQLPHARNREFCGVGGVPTNPTNIMNPIEELADLHATLSAHTNCATDGRNWRMMWQRLCEQRQEAIRNAFDDGMRKAVNAVCEKCGRGFSPLYRTECLQRWNRLPKCCATCAMKNLEKFLSEPEPDEIPNDQWEQRCQAVAGNGEGKVPTTAHACAPESPGSNSAAGADEAVAAQVNHLLNLEAAYKAVCEQREKIPFKWGPQPERDLLQERANELAGETMRTERRIIEGLKAFASERAAGVALKPSPAEEKYNDELRDAAK